MPLSRALSLLPEQVRAYMERSLTDIEKTDEIHLRSGCCAVITADGRRGIRLPVRTSPADIADTVSRICGGSLYAYSGSLREGYLPAGAGVRVGVCGRAVCTGGEISSVADISALCIRIPRAAAGAADGLVSLFGKTRAGIIVYSPPGVGKTTLLRDFIAQAGTLLSLSVAAVDSRGELTQGLLPPDCMCDALEGYPPGAGITQAARTLSPDVIVCDEICGEDAPGVLSAARCGVPVIASAHAGSFAELLSRVYLMPLFSGGVFSYTYGIKRTGTGFIYSERKIEAHGGGNGE